jgi:hypothetical protein
LLTAFFFITVFFIDVGFAAFFIDFMADFITDFFIGRAMLEDNESRSVLTREV